MRKLTDSEKDTVDVMVKRLNRDEQLHPEVEWLPNAGGTGIGWLMGYAEDGDIAASVQLSRDQFELFSVALPVVIADQAEKYGCSYSEFQTILRGWKLEKLKGAGI